jgi:hypothetical protein
MIRGKWNSLSNMVAPTMENRHRQLISNNRQPTPRNQNNQRHRHPDNLQSALDKRHPTTGTGWKNKKIQQTRLGLKNPFSCPPPPKKKQKNPPLDRRTSRNYRCLICHNLVVDIDRLTDGATFRIESAQIEIWVARACIPGKMPLHPYRAAGHKPLLERGPKTKFLDEIQTKDLLRVFLFHVHSHLYSFALTFLFLQTHTTSYIFLAFGYSTL